MYHAAGWRGLRALQGPDSSRNLRVVGIFFSGARLLMEAADDVAGGAGHGVQLLAQSLGRRGPMEQIIGAEGGGDAEMSGDAVRDRLGMRLLHLARERVDLITR